MENQINQLQSKYEEVKQEKETLTQNLSQAQSKITELEKKVNYLETELKTETIANNLMLDKEKKQSQTLRQELVSKQTEIVNYESQKQAGDRIIQQLKREVNELRVEKIQNKQELQTKDQRIQELSQQLEVMTKVMEQDLTSQVEFPPKGWN